MGHITSRHRCLPAELRFKASGSVSMETDLTIAGYPDVYATKVTLTWEVGEIARAEVGYEDGTVDTYELTGDHDSNLTVDVSGWPVCPTGKHEPLWWEKSA